MIARRTRINPISARRRREGAIYRVRAKSFLALHPFCQAWIEARRFHEEQVIQSKGWVIWRGKRVRAPRSVEVHHRSGRYQGNFLRESTWMAVCKKAHRWIHANPSEARERGWLT